MDDAPPAPGLHWSIKRSFILYVARMTDGQILGGHGLHMPDSSTFVFPPDAVSELAQQRFRGELRLRAHDGALSLRVANPRVDLGEDRSVLRIDHPDGGDRSLDLVTFTAAGVSASSTWTGTNVRLAVEAVSLFGGYYGEGEQFDDFTVVVPAP